MKMICVLPGILRDQRREVRRRLADRVAGDLHAAGPQDRLHAGGQPLRVGLLVVDDVDAGGLQLVADVVGHGRRLPAVVRHHAVEVADPVAVGVAVGERDACRRAGDEAEPAGLVGGRRSDDLLAAGRADDREHLRVGGERLCDIDRERGVDAELRVALDDLDLAVLARLQRVPVLDVGLRPAQLLLPDRRGRAGERCGHTDRAGRAAGNGRLRQRLGGAHVGVRNRGSRECERQNRRNKRRDLQRHVLPLCSIGVIWRRDARAMAARAEKTCGPS